MSGRYGEAPKSRMATGESRSLTLPRRLGSSTVRMGEEDEKEEDKEEKRGPEIMQISLKRKEYSC